MKNQTLLSRDFVPYHQLFVGGGSAGEIFFGVRQVFHVLSDFNTLGRCLRVGITAPVSLETPYQIYMDFRGIFFGSAASSVVEHHNFVKFLNEFASSLFKLQNVVDSFKYLNTTFLYKIQLDSGTILRLQQEFKRSLVECLSKDTEEAINYQDLLCYYLGIEPISDEKLFTNL